ncbi:MAG: class I SAM-dependent methyltransferase [Candidatus Neomarinimicrobiota bacterium]
MESPNYKSEVDRIIDVYDEYVNQSDKWSDSNLGNQIIYKERFVNIVKLFKKNKINLKDKKILDIGCAGGNLFPIFNNLGVKEKNINGIDIRLNRIDDAKMIYPKSRLKVMDARQLEFFDDTFDVIITFTLFSSILKNDFRKQIASEISRVLKPTGIILYYDFRYNNPFNKNVLRMKESDINILFPHMEKTLELITVFPPLIRNISYLSKTMYPLLSRFQFMKTHYIGLFRNIS